MRTFCQYCRARVISHRMQAHLKKCRQRKKYLTTHNGKEKDPLPLKIDPKTMQEIVAPVDSKKAIKVETVDPKTIDLTKLKPAEIKQESKEKKTTIKDVIKSKMSFLGTKAKK